MYARGNSCSGMKKNVMLKLCQCLCHVSIYHELSIRFIWIGPRGRAQRAVLRACAADRAAGSQPFAGRPVEARCSQKDVWRADKN